MHIAIPSYQRPEKLRDTTLKYLASEGIDPQMITVFMASEEQKTIYQTILVPGSYGQLVVGVPNLSAQRQFIRDYYPEDADVLSFDDDIKKIKMLTPRPLLEIAEKMFQMSREELCTLWGIYPVNNLFFCKERVIKGKAYIIGCCYGFINKKDDCSFPSVSGAEDMWLSLKRAQLDGAVLRYEGICPDTVYYAKGGLSEYRKTTDIEKLDKEKVVAEFPDECEMKLKRNGHWEVHYKTKAFKKLSLM